MTFDAYLAELMFWLNSTMPDNFSVSYDEQHGYVELLCSGSVSDRIEIRSVVQANRDQSVDFVIELITGNLLDSIQDAIVEEFRAWWPDPIGDKLPMPEVIIDAYGNLTCGYIAEGRWVEGALRLRVSGLTM